MVARLEGTKDITPITDFFSTAGYEVSIKDKKVAFVYRNGTSLNDLKTDIKSAKASAKFTGNIKVFHGATSVGL